MRHQAGNLLLRLLLCRLAPALSHPPPAAVSPVQPKAGQALPRLLLVLLGDEVQPLHPG